MENRHPDAEQNDSQRRDDPCRIAYMVAMPCTETIADIGVTNDDRRSSVRSPSPGVAQHNVDCVDYAEGQRQPGLPSGI